MIQFSFDAEVIYWRGPSPFFFAPIPLRHGSEIKRISKLASYGWGVIPVEAVVRNIAFRTSLFPKDDIYLLPLKDAVRRTGNITAGDSISACVTIRLGTDGASPDDRLRDS